MSDSFGVFTALGRQLELSRLCQERELHTEAFQLLAHSVEQLAWLWQPTGDAAVSRRSLLAWLERYLIAEDYEEATAEQLARLFEATFGRGYDSPSSLKEPQTLFITFSDRAIASSELALQWCQLAGSIRVISFTKLLFAVSHAASRFLEDMQRDPIAMSLLDAKACQLQDTSAKLDPILSLFDRATGSPQSSLRDL